MQNPTAAIRLMLKNTFFFIILQIYKLFLYFLLLLQKFLFRNKKTAIYA